MREMTKINLQKKLKELKIFNGQQLSIVDSSSIGNRGIKVNLKIL